MRGGRAGFGMHAGLWLEYDQEAIIGLQTSTHPFAFGVGGGSREKRSLPTSLREVLRAGLPAVLQRCRRVTTLFLGALPDPEHTTLHPRRRGSGTCACPWLPTTPAMLCRTGEYGQEAIIGLRESTSSGAFGVGRGILLVVRYRLPAF